MPDTIRSMFSCHRHFLIDRSRFLRAAKPRTRRSEAQETAPVDDPEIAATEAGHRAAVVALGETDELADQRLADEHLLAFPLDRPTGPHAAHLMIGVVPRIVETPRHGAGRRPPTRRRRDLSERLVRPLLVVMPAEAVEPHLLRSRRRGGRVRGL